FAGHRIREGTETAAPCHPLRNYTTVRLLPARQVGVSCRVSRHASTCEVLYTGPAALRQPLTKGRADFIGRPKANEMKLSRCIVDMRRASLAPSRTHRRLRLRGTKRARFAKPRAADSARASARRFDAGHLADQGVERLEVDRLGEVREEPGLVAAAHVLLHAVAAQRDPLEVVLLAELPHQIEAAA